MELLFYKDNKYWFVLFGFRWVQDFGFKVHGWGLLKTKNQEQRIKNKESRAKNQEQRTKKPLLWEIFSDGWNLWRTLTTSN